MCCVDALEIDAMRERWAVEELRPTAMRRELNKLLAAWRDCEGATIETGHWGAGCSPPMPEAIDRLLHSPVGARGVTVGALYGALVALGEQVPHHAVTEPVDLWALMRHKLGVPAPP